VVGIGADGWAGLSERARAAVLDASVVLGGKRQLDMLDRAVSAEKVAWPSPLLPALPGLLETYGGTRLVVLASGDPLFFGIGGTLVERLGAENVQVLPVPSSLSLACARLGWPVQDVEVISAVGRPLAALHPAVQSGRRLLVLAATSGAATAVCELLVERGWASGPRA
jgi:precorrin-6Y C5,15-methyltransferase (decarboxylating)